MGPDVPAPREESTILKYPMYHCVGSSCIDQSDAIAHRTNIMLETEVIFMRQLLIAYALAVVAKASVQLRLVTEVVVRD
jgi:hypothetical protein